MENILIVVDMQKDFVDGALGTAEAQSIVPAVVREIESGRYDRIFVTYDTHGENYPATLEGQKLPVPHCIKGSAGWAMDARVAAALAGRACTAVEKPTFGSVALAEELAALPKAALTLVGLCTDICVVSNALLLRAFAPNRSIRVLSAACAGTSPAAHRAALATMASCQIDIL